MIEYTHMYVSDAEKISFLVPYDMVFHFQSSMEDSVIPCASTLQTHSRTLWHQSFHSNRQSMKITLGAHLGVLPIQSVMCVYTCADIGYGVSWF